MRRLVPSLSRILLGITFCAPYLAWSQSNFYDSVSSFGNAPSECGAEPVCYNSKVAYCRILGQDIANCSAQVQNVQKTSCTASSSSAQELEQYKKSNAYRAAHAEAQTCCAIDKVSAANCIREYGSPDAQAKLKAINDRVSAGASGGPQVNDASKQDGAMAAEVAAVSSAIAGACRAATEICAVKISKAADGCAIPGLKESFDNEAKKCRAMRKNGMEEQLKQALLAKDKADDVGNKSKDNPPGGPSGPGEKTANGGKSGGGGMNPGMMGAMMQQMAQQMMKQDEETPAVDIPAPVECSVNPALAGCGPQNAAANSWNTASASSTQTDADNSGGSFDTPDISGMQPASADSGLAAAGAPMTNAGVPNGGGGMPGGGGGGAASLGSSGATGGGGVGSPSIRNTDVLHGERSGGFSSVAANMNLKSGDSGGGYNYGNGYGRGEENLDLSAFLPGGKQDPLRKLAGGNATNFQIQSKDVNLFSRISERIRSRCAQGLLRDCIP